MLKTIEINDLVQSGCLSLIDPWVLFVSAQETPRGAAEVQSLKPPRGVKQCWNVEETLLGS